MKKHQLQTLLTCILIVFLFSCKKKKGALDDFDSGRFDFVCIWNKNGVQDTLTGEVTGLYTNSSSYLFMVRQEPGSTVIFISKEIIHRRGGLTPLKMVTLNLFGGIRQQARR